MRHLFILAGLVLALQGASGQEVDLDLLLSDGDPLTSDNAFGVTLDPDGVHAYVALCGDLDFSCPSTPATAGVHNNDKVLKVDLLTGTVAAQGTAGLYPEDVALALDASGATRHVYVTDGTSGTVTCLTPGLQHVATVPLTPCLPSFCGNGTFASIFPFGILASPDSTRVYVVTTGGCGTIDVIDSDPVSPSFNTVVSSFAINGATGRPRWISHPQMVVPVADFANDRVGIAVVDVTNPGGAAVHYGYQGAPGTFPSVSDVAVRSDGRVILPVAFAQTPLVVEIDTTTGLVTGSLDLGSHVTTTGLHGVTLSEDGGLAVVTALTGQGPVAFLNVSGSFWTIASVWDMGAGTLPNAVAFTRDQSRVVVTSQGASRLAVLRDLPGHELALDAPAGAPIGSPLQLSVDGIEHGQPASLYTSLAGPGPQLIGGHLVFLSDPFILLAALTGDVNGDAAVSFGVPNAAVLVGITFHLQAVTADRSGALRFSDGAATTLL